METERTGDDDSQSDLAPDEHDKNQPLSPVNYDNNHRPLPLWIATVYDAVLDEPPVSVSTLDYDPSGGRHEALLDRQPQEDSAGEAILLDDVEQNDLGGTSRGTIVSSHGGHAEYDHLALQKASEVVAVAAATTGQSTSREHCTHWEVDFIDNVASIEPTEQQPPKDGNAEPDVTGQASECNSVLTGLTDERQVENGAAGFEQNRLEEQFIDSSPKVEPAEQRPAIRETEAVHDDLPAEQPHEEDSSSVRSSEVTRLLPLTSSASGGIFSSSLGPALDQTRADEDRERNEQSPAIDEKKQDIQLSILQVNQYSGVPESTIPTELNDQQPAEDVTALAGLAGQNNLEDQSVDIPLDVEFDDDVEPAEQQEFVVVPFHARPTGQRALSEQFVDSSVVVEPAEQRAAVSEDASIDGGPPTQRPQEEPPSETTRYQLGVCNLKSCKTRLFSGNSTFQPIGLLLTSDCSHLANPGLEEVVPEQDPGRIQQGPPVQTHDVEESPIATLVIREICMKSGPVVQESYPDPPLPWLQGIERVNNLSDMIDDDDVVNNVGSEATAMLAELQDPTRLDCTCTQDELAVMESEDPVSGDDQSDSSSQQCAEVDFEDVNLDEEDLE